MLVTHQPVPGNRLGSPKEYVRFVPREPPLGPFSESLVEKTQ